MMSRTTAKLFLWRIAMACAVLLLFAPATPRTSWIYAGGGGMTHSAGWDWVAPLSGIVAIGALALTGRSCPRGAASVLGNVVAVFAFGVSAAASAGHWYSLATGSLDLEWESTTYPAPLVLPFAVIAAVGAVCALALLGTRLRPAEDEQ